MEPVTIYSTKLLTKFYPRTLMQGMHGKDGRSSDPKTGDRLRAGKLLTVKEARKDGSRR